MAWQTGATRRHAPLTPAVLDPGTEVRDSNVSRIYLHIDMDAFFASVEERDNPALSNKPVAVGGGPGNRGVVTTANYIARRYGVRSGMPAVEAKRKCAALVFLPVNGAKYMYVSAQIMTVLEKYSPIMRPLSVDEASLDITGCEKAYGGYGMLGQTMKDEIQDKFNLPATIGIGPNRLVAKVAAGMAKPDGLLVLDQEGARRAFAPLPVDDMTGIGKSTKAALEQLGIFTLGDLAEYPESLLKIRFGIWGPNLRKMARGEWAGRMKLDDEREPEEKSIGHSRTFGENINDPHELRSRLVGLAEMVARRARRSQVVGHKLTVKIRYPDFKTPTHQMRLPKPTDDEEMIIDYGWKLLDEIWKKGEPIRLLGISLGSLAKKKEWSGQLDMFVPRRKLMVDDLYKAVDSLRDRFGESVVARAMGRRYIPKSRHSRKGEVIPFGQARHVEHSKTAELVSQG